MKGLAAGEKADFVVFDFDEAAKSIRIRETWVSGNCFYRE
jgi:predicted amidohydrolase YtcJ